LWPASGPADRATWLTRCVVTRRKGSSEAKGLAIEATVLKLAAWVTANRDLADAARRRAVKVALVSVRRLWTVDVARGLARQFVGGIAIQGSDVHVTPVGPPGREPRPVILDRVEPWHRYGWIDRAPETRPLSKIDIDRHGLFGALVALFRLSDFTFREIVLQLLDDGGGGSTEQRIDRAKKRAKAVSDDALAALRAALEGRAKGKEGPPVGAAFPREGEHAVVKSSVADEVTDGSERSLAGRGGSARDARTRCDRPVVDPHRQAARVAAGATAARSPERPRRVAIGDGGQTSTPKAEPSPPHRAQRTRSQARGRGPAKARVGER
jgi:hypothetical protein